MSTQEPPASADPEPPQPQGSPAGAPAVADAASDAVLSDEQARDHIGAAQGINRRRTIIGAIIAIVFLAFVFARVIPQIGDYSEAATYIQQMTTLSMISLVGILLLYLFVYGWPFVASTPGLSYRQGFVVNQSAFAVSNGVPAGGAFALGLEYAQLTSYRATPTVATASIGATGVWSVFVTLFLPVTGVAALALSGDDASSYVLAAVLGFAALIVIVGLFAVILRSEAGAVRVGDIADRIGNAIIGRIRRGKQVHLKSQILRLRHDIVDLVRRRWHVITLTQIAVSWAQFAILYTAIVGLSRGQTGAPLLVVYGCWAIAQLGIMVPVTPGGLGTVDAVLIGLLTTFGIDNGVATAADLVWRAASYIPQMAIGLICIFGWRWAENRRKRREAASAAA